MHELSIALSILDIASEESERQGGGLVQAIHIRIGPLSGVVKEALLSAFQLAREVSSFTECRLVIEEVPITIYCTDCAAERPIESMYRMCCRQCSGPAAYVVGGREMEVTAMEIEELSKMERSDILQREA